MREWLGVWGRRDVVAVRSGRTVVVGSGRMANTEELFAGRGAGADGRGDRVGEGERGTDWRPRPRSWMGLGIRESRAERGVALSVVGDRLGGCRTDRGAAGDGGARAV